MSEAKFVTEPQPAEAVESWLKALGRPNPRAELVRLVDGYALVRSRDGQRYYLTAVDGKCNCPAGRFGQTCRHVRMVQAAYHEPNVGFPNRFKPEVA